jgi:hypothetical protein
MENEIKSSGLVTGMAITGLVLGIAGLLFSLIPCLGMFGVYPAGMGIVAALVAVVAAVMMKAQKGLAVASLVVSLVGFGMAVKEIYNTNARTKALNDFMKKP